MKKHSVVAHARVALLSGAAVLAMGGYGAAQENGNANNNIETVTVTGTRIARPETDFSNPVMSTTSADLQHQGVTSLSDYLKTVPALAGSYGNFQTSGYNTPAATDASSLGGLDLLNLRNLGYIRTLVLIDGHRSVSESTGSAAIDTNTIPITLIDRVDVATGGASAVYGADGVSGVVNFVLKHNLEGIHASVQAGTSDEGGGTSTLSAISVGHNFDDDAGNLTLTFEHGYQDPLFYTQRRFTRVGGEAFLVSNPLEVGAPDDPSVPDNIFSNDVQYIYSSLHGAIETDAGFFNEIPDRVGTGAPYIFDFANYVGNASWLHSSGMDYANDLQGDFQPLNRRVIGQVDAHYDFADFFKVRGQFKFADIDSQSRSTAPFDDLVLITADNPFLPANVAADMIANNGGLGILSEDYLSLRNIERIKRKTYTGLLEVQGDIPNPSFLDNLHYNVSYTYGQTDVDDIQVNNRISDRFLYALDSVTDAATGKPTCRSNLNPAAAPPDFSDPRIVNPDFQGSYYSDTMGFFPGDPLSFTPGSGSGCAAFNPFDPNFDNQAALNFVTAPTHTYGAIMQHVVNGYLSADLPAFENMGMAGPLSLVAGFEYRKEMSQSTPDAIEQGSNAWISGYQPVSGQFDVREFFGEASAPIIKDGFIEELTLDGAVRQSHYSTAGDSTSWKFGGVLSPIDGLKFRATQAFAVRAPNIGELFSPSQALFEGLNDPCDATQVHNGTGFRVANCQALFAAMGVPYDPTTADLGTGATTQVNISSNPLLQPESARTVTAGVVIQPPGSSFTLTVDWYRVNLSNAIEALSAQVITQECVDLSTIANPFCAQITRDPGGFVPGAVAAVDSQTINVANFGTSGVEWNLTYHLDLADIWEKEDSSVDFRLLGAYLNTLTRRPIANEAQEEHANEEFGGEDGTPAPRWQANLDMVWTKGDWSVDWDVDWYNGVLITTRQTAFDQPDFVEPGRLYTAPRFVHNLQVGWDFKPGFQAYVGANNVFYQKPSYGQNGYPVDPLGRFFYVGLRADTDFGNL